MPLPRTVIFDLDDTLIDTTPAYMHKIDALVDLLASDLPEVPRETIRAVQETIDLRLVEAHGFSSDRFPASFVETYHQLAREQGVRLRPEIETACLALGKSVFDKPPAMVDGAVSLLDDLQGRCELMLYTMGVRELQEWKIDHHCLAPRFDEIHIVSDKTVDRLRTVVGARRPNEVMVVGDSLRCEIAPAVSLGCRAVWVKRAIAWKFHDATVDGDYSAIERLHELRRHL